VKGVIANFPVPVKNFTAVIATNIPVGSGLSSSAALEAATFLFLESLIAPDLDISLTEKAKICQKAEHEFAGV
jgi:galactokinase